MTNTTFRLHISSMKDLANLYVFTKKFPESGVLNLTNSTFPAYEYTKVLANFPMNDVTLICGNLDSSTSAEMEAFIEKHGMDIMNPEYYPLGSIAFQAM